MRAIYLVISRIRITSLATPVPTAILALLMVNEPDNRLVNFVMGTLKKQGV